MDATELTSNKTQRELETLRKRVVELENELASFEAGNESLQTKTSILYFMIESSPLGCLVVDNRTDEIIHFNHKFCELWGIEQLEERLRRGELKNSDIIRHCMPLMADAAGFAESFKSLQSEENRAVVEDEIPFANGRVIRSFSTQVRDQDNRNLGRFYIFEDITSKKLHEKSLQTTRIELERTVQERTEELRKINRHLLAEVNERKEVEQRERKNARDLEILYESAMQCVELAPKVDIHQFIGEYLHKILGSSIILVNEYDKNSDSIICRSIHGLGKNITKVIDFIGQNLIGMSFKINDDDARIGLKSGKLVKVPGGIYELSFKKIPKPICRSIEKLLDINEIYAIGFSRHGRLYGSATILLSKDAVLNIRTLETFAHQSSIALHRKQAEESMQKSEALYRAIVEDLPILICRFLTDGTITFVNEAYAQYFGKKREELIGYNFIMLIPEEDREYVRNQFQSLNSKNPVATYEHRVITKNGEIRWQRWIDRAVFVDDDIVEYQSIGEDITDRKRAEEYILRQSAKLDAINKVLQESFKSGSIEDMADTCLKIAEELTSSKLGFIGEINEDGFFDTLAFDTGGWKDDKVAREKTLKKISRQEIQGLWGKVLQEQKPIIDNDLSNYIDHASFPSGHPRLISFLGVPLKKHDGTFGLIALANKKSGYDPYDQEIIETLSVTFSEALIRKRAEEDLRASEERFRRLAENSTDVIWTMDFDLNCTYLSPSVMHVFGYPSVEEARILPIEQDLTSNGYGQVKKILQEELEIEKKTSKNLHRSRILELQQYTRDGKLVWTEIQVTFLRDSSGKPIGLLGITRDISERKKAEEALRESEERFRLLAENTSDVIWTTDLNLKYTYVSPSVVQLFGWSSQEEALSRTIADDLLPEDIAMGMQVYQEEMEIEKQEKKNLRRSRTFEFKQRTKDGGLHWTEVKLNFLRDSNGKAIGFLGITRDISERKKAEEAIHKLNQFQQIIIDNASMWLDVLDEKGNVLIWNKAAEKISGYSREKVIGHGKIWEWLYPDKQYRNDIFAKALRIIEQGETAKDFETTIRCKNGQYRVISWFSQSLSDEKGNIIGSIAVGSDVTERKQAEEALRDSEEKFRTLAETAGVAIFIYKENRFLYVNPIMEKVLGFTEKEILNMNVWDLIHPDFREIVQQRAIARLKKEDLPLRYEVKVITKEGQSLWVDFSTGIIEYERKPAALGTAIDISERKQVEEALRQSEQKLSEQNFMLEQKNIALRELMDQVKAEKEKMEDHIKKNIIHLLFPLLERMKMKGSKIDPIAINLLEENLKNLTSPFGAEISKKMIRLTQREIEISNLIKSGLSSKEIAKLSDISVRSVTTHRNNIRKKLGIQNKDINLTTYLKQL